MKTPTTTLKITFAAVAMIAATAMSVPAHAKLAANGRAYNGKNLNSPVANGNWANGLSYNGKSPNSFSANGRSYNGQSYQGRSYNGLTSNGRAYQGRSWQGRAYNGTSARGDELHATTIVAVTLPSQ